MRDYCYTTEYTIKGPYRYGFQRALISAFSFVLIWAILRFVFGVREFTSGSTSASVIFGIFESMARTMSSVHPAAIPRSKAVPLRVTLKFQAHPVGASATGVFVAATYRSSSSHVLPINFHKSSRSCLFRDEGLDQSFWSEAYIVAGSPAAVIRLRSTSALLSFLKTAVISSQ